MKLSAFFCTLLAVIACKVQAATVTFGPDSTNVALASTFTLEIVGYDFTGTEGGGASFTFDATVLQVNSITIDDGVWGIYDAAGTIDNVNGSVEGIAVAAFNDPGTQFTVATIEFEAIGYGTSMLILEENPLNPWASAGSVITPTLIDGLVTVVPVPAAIWLFGTGVLGLLVAGRPHASRT